MNTFFLFLVGAGFALICLSPFLLLFRRTRMWRWKPILSGVALLVLGLWLWTPPSKPEADRKAAERAALMQSARGLGFGSIEEMERAKAAGFANAAAWSKSLADAAELERASEEKRRQEEETRRAQAADVAAKAGFPSAEEYSRALEAGVKTMGEWQAHKVAQNERELTSAALKAAGRNVISARTMARMNGAALQVEIKANGLTSGLDFFDFGSKIGAITQAIRPFDDGLVELVAILHVSTIDKYGNNAGLSKAAVIVWKLSELQKVNFQLGPDYTFQNADQVDLTRFGREMAVAYCSDSALRDVRYCR